MNPLSTLLSRLALSARVRTATHVLGLTQIIGWGTTMYVPAILARPIVDDTGWSRTAVFAAFSCSLIIGAVAARPVGRIIDASGGRTAMAVGSGLTALGLLVASLATTLPVYFVAWAILGIAMRLVLYEAAFTALAVAGGPDARRAISVLTLYGGFASTIFWPIGWAIAESFGWRATFAAFAALNLFICLPLHALFLPKAASAGSSGASRSETAPRSDAILKDQDRNFALIVLTIAFALLMYVNSALSAHLIDTLVAFGLPGGTAVSIASLRGVGQVAARLWEILMAAGLQPMTLCLVAIGLTPLAFLILLLGIGALTATMFALAQGASNGLVTIVRGVVPLLLFGSKNYGALVGTMTAPALMAAALAPALHAAAVDLAGHGVAMALNAAAASIAFLLVLVLAMRLRRRA